MVRVTRIGKLYRLFKIFRLLRVAKIFKGQFIKNILDFFNIQEGFKRIVTTFMLFMLIAHFMACFWIFTANISLTEVIDETG